VSTKTFDPKCYELAKAFLGDRDGISEMQIRNLACEIQSTVEDYIDLNVVDPGAHQVAVQ
jgi:hypothetical protein